MPAPNGLPQRTSRGLLRVGRTALVVIVMTYLAVVLMAPMASLAVETGRIGVGEAFSRVVQPNALAALEATLILVLIALPVNAIIGTFGAIAIVRHRFAGREIVSALCDLPLAVSPVMIGLAFLLMVGRDGLLAPLLRELDWKVVFAFPGLIVATLFVTLPYTIREVSYVLEEIGTSQEEAATTLGASHWQTFWRITLPNIRVALGYGLLMTIARSLGEFGAVLVLGGSISGQTQTATTFIHDAMEERETAGAYGMAAVLGLTSIVLLLALEWAKDAQARAQSRTTS